MSGLDVDDAAYRLHIIRYLTDYKNIQMAVDVITQQSTKSTLISVRPYISVYTTAVMILSYIDEVCPSS